jgi:Matrixin
VVSGETGAGVPGVEVTVGADSTSADGGGGFSVPREVAPQTTVTLSAGGFLLRETTLAAAVGGRFTLWPMTSASGIDELLTQELVYTAFDANAPRAGEPLQRWSPGQAPVDVVLDPIFDGSPDVVAAQAEAVRRINALLGGRPQYREPVVGGGGAAPGRIYVRVDPNEPGCGRDVLALAHRFFDARNEISHGEVVYCRSVVTRSPTVALHELGHTLGLQHSSNLADLMHIAVRADDFTSRERAIVSLMYQRPAGNRFPDNDRSALGSLSRAPGRVTIRCVR